MEPGRSWQGPWALYMLKPFNYSLLKLLNDVPFISSFLEICTTHSLLVSVLAPLRVIWT
jgi:hypothetical protein